MSDPAEGAAAARFQRDVARMLLTFFAVWLIDLVVISVVGGRLRFWFPLWLDREWATRPDPWVTYSQSYLAGILCIPLLARAVARDFLAARPFPVRLLFWVLTLGTLGFIAWWKGGLMIEHGKGREAVGWAALTALVWGLIRASEILPASFARTNPRTLLRRLLLGVSIFFLGMSLIDPALQVGVQGLGWSSGLLIEMGFFIPAGLTLLWVSRKLKPPSGAPCGAPGSAGVSSGASS